MNTNQTQAAAILNSAKAFILNTLAQNGYTAEMLQEEFKTRADFFNFVISFTIKALMNRAGCSIDEAYEIVFGDGSWQGLIGQVYSQINNANHAAA